MTMQLFPNYLGIPLIHPGSGISQTDSFADAIGEGCFFIGKCYLSSGPGTSKIISSAGGKVIWYPGASTFVNGATILRVGIQDVDTTTGFPDGTFDVYKDLVGGIDSIATAPLVTSMANGTKTINYGDLIAIGGSLTGRGGADFVRINRLSNLSNFPYTITNTGSNAKTPNTPEIQLEFDDGTIGYLADISIPRVLTNVTFGLNSTPDEYALIFRLPFKATISQLIGIIGDVDNGDHYELILYSDPLGTPAVIEAISVDADVSGQTGANIGTTAYDLSTSYTLAINTYYAIALRPTTAGTILLQTATNFHSLLGTMLGNDWMLGTRTNQTGAFTPTTTSLPFLGAMLNKFDDGTGGGGGGTKSYAG